MAKEKEDDLESEIISPINFMKRGYTHWIEAHWSFCGNERQAKDWFEAKGFVGEIFAMTYDNLDKKSDPSILGWWMPVQVEE